MNRVVNQDNNGWLGLYIQNNPKRVTLILIACVIFLMLLSWTEFYSSVPIRGKVIDSNTNKPVEGAIVMADWLVVGEEGRHLQYLAVKEAVTDSNGNFELAGWGPKIMSYAPYAVLRYDEPTLRIFKSGYIPIVQRNNLAGKKYHPLFNSVPFTFNGMTYKFEPFEGTVKEYAEKYRDLSASMIGFYPDTDRFCQWRKIPRFLIALDKQEKIFLEHGIATSIYELVSIGTKRCGSAPEVFEGYLNEMHK